MTKLIAFLGRRGNHEIKRAYYYHCEKISAETGNLKRGNEISRQPNEKDINGESE